MGRSLRSTHGDVDVHKAAGDDLERPHQLVGLLDVLVEALRVERRDGERWWVRWVWRERCNAAALALGATGGRTSSSCAPTVTRRAAAGAAAHAATRATNAEMDTRDICLFVSCWCVGLVLWRRRRSADASAHAAEQVADCVAAGGGAEWIGAGQGAKEGSFLCFCSRPRVKNPNQKHINAIRPSRRSLLALNRSLQHSVADPDDLPRRKGAFERRSAAPEEFPQEDVSRPPARASAGGPTSERPAAPRLQPPRSSADGHGLHHRLCTSVVC